MILMYDSQIIVSASQNGGGVGGGSGVWKLFPFPISVSFIQSYSHKHDATAVIHSPGHFLPLALIVNKSPPISILHQSQKTVRQSNYGSFLLLGCQLQLKLHWNCQVKLPCDPIHSVKTTWHKGTTVLQSISADSPEIAQANQTNTKPNPRWTSIFTGHTDDSTWTNVIDIFAWKGVHNTQSALSIQILNQSTESTDGMFSKQVDW